MNKVRLSQGQFNTLMFLHNYEDKFFSYFYNEFPDVWRTVSSSEWSSGKTNHQTNAEEECVVAVIVLLASMTDLLKEIVSIQQEQPELPAPYGNMGYALKATHEKR